MLDDALTAEPVQQRPQHGQLARNAGANVPEFVKPGQIRAHRQAIHVAETGNALELDELPKRFQVGLIVSNRERREPSLCLQVFLKAGDEGVPLFAFHC